MNMKFVSVFLLCFSAACFGEYPWADQRCGQIFELKMNMIEAGLAKKDYEMVTSAIKMGNEPLYSSDEEPKAECKCHETIACGDNVSFCFSKKCSPSEKIIPIFADLK